MARKNQEKIILTHTCSICGEIIQQTNKFSHHLYYTHNITPEEYTLKYFCAGVRPVCKYCGAETIYEKGKFCFKVHCPKHGNEYRREWSKLNGFGAKVDQNQALGKTKENYEYLQKKSEEMKEKWTVGHFTQDKIDAMTEARLKTEAERGSRKLKEEKYLKYCRKAMSNGYKILTPFEETNSRRVVMDCECLVCKENFTMSNEVIQTTEKIQTYGCPKCTLKQIGELNSEKFKMSKERFEEISAKTLKDNHLKILLKYEDYKNNRMYTDYECTECGYKGQKKIFSIANGLGCYKCNKMGTSKMEEEVFRVLTDRGYNAIKNYKLYSDPDNDRRKYKEIDIFFPDHNFGIEIDGLYWHSSKEKPSEYHRDKYEYCKLLGIKILNVFEDEWREHSELILDIIDVKCDRGIVVNSADCNIWKLDDETVQDFLKDNWIEDLNSEDGFGGSSNKMKTVIGLGLYYGEDLMAVLRLREMEDRGFLEISQYVTKRGYCVEDCFKKMFNHVLREFENKFKKEYPLVEFFMIKSDRRFREGKEFLKSNFKFYDVEEEYFYTNFEERYSINFNGVEDPLKCVQGIGEKYYQINTSGKSLYFHKLDL
jgi:hypothetical protein